jgi:hypothetical protein
MWREKIVALVIGRDGREAFVNGWNGTFTDLA